MLYRSWVGHFPFSTILFVPYLYTLCRWLHISFQSEKGSIFKFQRNLNQISDINILRRHSLRAYIYKFDNYFSLQNFTTVTIFVVKGYRLNLSTIPAFKALSLSLSLALQVHTHTCMTILSSSSSENLSIFLML